MTIMRDGLVVFTVAVAGPRSSMLISPKKSPGPRVRRFLPSMITSAAPSSNT